MKCRLALILLLSATVPVFSASPTQKHPFFRPHQKAGSRQAGPLIRPAAEAASAVVVNAASFLPGVSPGGLASIFGQNLSSVTDIVQAGSLPLPVELANVQVFVNGIAAPLFTVAYNGQEDQINFQVPYEAPTGPKAVEIQVFNLGAMVADFQADSFTEDPGVFAYGDNYAVAFLGSDGSLIGPANPAFPGDILVLYTTGLGPLTVDLLDGYGAPTDPLAYTEDPFQVLVDGEACSVSFSGLAPGFVALYQINLQLPSDLRSGNLGLQIASQYASSGVVTLPVQ